MLANHLWLTASLDAVVTSVNSLLSTNVKNDGMPSHPPCPMTCVIQEKKECLYRWEVASVKVTKEEETFNEEAKETESQGQEQMKGKEIKGLHFRLWLSMRKMKETERLSFLNSKWTPGIKSRQMTGDPTSRCTNSPEKPDLTLQLPSLPSLIPHKGFPLYIFQRGIIVFSIPKIIFCMIN